MECKAKGGAGSMDWMDLCIVESGHRKEGVSLDSEFRSTALANEKKTACDSVIITTLRLSRLVKIPVSS